MAEDDDRGGGKGTVKLPKIGAVQKKPVIIIAVVAGAYVIWRYYQASQASGAAAQDAAAADEYGDAGTIPAVTGQGPITGYGPAPQDTSADSYGFNGTTNAQWTQYASTQLSASDQWSYTDIVTALGQYIANKPLTAVQQQIVQAAIALAGNPPEGTHVVVPGGDTPITVAPTGLKAWDVTTDSQIGFQWNPVAGADHYRIFRTDLGSEPIGDSIDTKFWARGLKSNTTYHFQVQALSAAGQGGPKSSTYTAKTKAVSLAKPTGVKVSSVTKTTAVASCSAVKGATGYIWYINNVAHGHSDGPKYELQGLKANTAYKLSVKADTDTQAPGQVSSQVSFRTKK